MLLLTGGIISGLYAQLLTVIDAVSSVVSKVYQCPIHYFTGISCAGCGLTRAWLSVLHGNFSQAFYFHPLFWTIPLVVLVFLFRKRIPGKAKKILLYGTIALFLVVYVIRLADPSNTIVVFEPQNGAVFRVIGQIRDLLSS